MEQVEEMKDALRDKRKEEQPEGRWEQSHNEDSESELSNRAGTLPGFGEAKALHQTSDSKSKSIRYFKGLFGRIIMACLLFLLLFLGRMFSANVFGQSAESVVKEIRNNEFVEALEQKLTDIFQSDKDASQIEK